MTRSLVLAAVLAAAPALQAQAAPRDARAQQVLDRAIARMGGETALRSVKTLRADFMTMWQRTSWASQPYADQPSYERHVALYDFEARLWRNTRTFLPGTQGSVDIVRDTVGQRAMTDPKGQTVLSTLNAAYVDDRREQFAFAPERTLLLAREASDLRRLADTTIDGVRHARVSATVDGFPATWFLRDTDGLPAFVRFRADETNDFGLAPWGMQEVEIWWSGWTRVPPSIWIPRQRDTRRVGRPYKRMTVMGYTINAPAPADSFAMADSVVTRYLATEQRPMWALSLDSTRVMERDFVSFPPFTGSAGAVRVGGTWVLLETAQAPGAVDRLAAWFKTNTPDTPIGAGVMTMTRPSNGGVAWFAHHALPTAVAPGAASMLPALVSNATERARVSIVGRARWMRVGTDSIWLEPIDLPDAQGTMAVYVPTLRWLYNPLLTIPAYQPESDALIARLRAKGWPVEWIGNTRGLRTAAPK